ncbi:hypothetical protein QBC47DRAFT_458848 [Echria macrotheca]|uniref:DUF7726 domain-containing protein n=1 Tax=Echria macrotheca TaxID=438768 RepID=A0AAJ0BFI2_9PEZI|nr:hypothetical protein QBC47DRAFT_458848 [Echria macrotheca]
MTRSLTLQDILNPLDTNQVINQPPISGSTRDGDTCNPLENGHQNTPSHDENDAVITKVTKLNNPAHGISVSAHPAVRPRNANSKPNVSKLLDVSGIHLEGEEFGTVPIYDTCDSVRRKIRAFLRRDGVTQAALLRALADCRPLEDRGKPISATSYQKFMRQTGASSGAGSIVFYAGYVFFEKIRLRDKKPKTKFREEMESVWGNSEDPVTALRIV